MKWLICIGCHVSYVKKSIFHCMLYYICFGGYGGIEQAYNFIILG